MHAAFNTAENFVHFTHGSTLIGSLITVYYYQRKLVFVMTRGLSKLEISAFCFKIFQTISLDYYSIGADLQTDNYNYYNVVILNLMNRNERFGQNFNQLAISHTR